MKNFDRDYRHHPPRDKDDASDHERVRKLVGHAAKELDSLLPQGREAAVTQTKLEEAMFWANAALARGRYDEEEG